MPVEIRELVIQAQVNEQGVNEENSDPQINQDNNIALNKIEEMVHQYVNDENHKMADFLMKEMKIWVKEYLKQQERRF